MMTAVSDPHEVQLALTTPPRPSIDAGADAVMIAGVDTDSPLVPAAKDQGSTDGSQENPAGQASTGIRIAQSAVSVSEDSSDGLPQPRVIGSPLRVAATNLDGFKFDREDIGDERDLDTDFGPRDRLRSNSSKRTSSPFYENRVDTGTAKPDFYRPPPSVAMTDSSESQSDDRRVPEPTLDVFEDELQIVTIDEVIDEGRIARIARAEAEKYFTALPKPDRGEHDDASLAREIIRELIAARLAVPARDIQQQDVTPLDQAQGPESPFRTPLLGDMTPSASSPDLDVEQRHVTSSIADLSPAESFHREEETDAVADVALTPYAEAVADGRYTFRIANHPLVEVLNLFAKEGGLNILPSEQVQGEVASDLHDVTADQALAALARAHNLVVEHEPPFIYVTTRAEAEERSEASACTVTQVFHPTHVSVETLLPVIEPLLTAKNGSATAIQRKPAEESNSSVSAGLAKAIVVVDSPDVMGRISDIVRELDQPVRQVAIEAVLLNVYLNGDQPRGACHQLFAEHLTPIFPIHDPARIDGATDSFTLCATTRDIETCLATLRATNYTKILASPKLTILDGHESELLTGDRIAVPTNSSRDTGPSGVDVIESGTKLVLRPSIATDGRIRLDLHPERSSAAINPVTRLPVQNTRELTTSVVLRDGETLVIGGLIDEKISRHVKRVPVLSAIPGVGHKFREQHKRIYRTEFVVLLTAHIVHDQIY